MKIKFIYKDTNKSTIIEENDTIIIKLDYNYQLSPLGSNIDELKNNYREIINVAMENNLEKLYLSLLGLNKFKRRDSYLAITEVFEEYLGIKSPLKIYFNLFNNSLKQYKMLNCSRLKGDELYTSLSDAGPYLPKSLKYSVTINKIFSTMNTNEMLIPMGDINRPIDFIDEYMTINNIKKSYLYANGFDKDDCSKCRCGRKTFKKEDCYRASIVLGFNRTEVLQLMSYSGYAFNPNDDLDIWFYEYLKKNKLLANMAEFQDLYYDEEVLAKIFNGQ